MNYLWILMNNSELKSDLHVVAISNEWVFTEMIKIHVIFVILWFIIYFFLLSNYPNIPLIFEPFFDWCFNDF